MIIPNGAINLIINLWPMLVLSLVVLIMFRGVYLYRTKAKFVLYRELFSLCFVVYILLLFELVTSTDFGSVSNNFVPFREILRYAVHSKLYYRNVIGNIVLFVPFGFFASYFCKNNRGYITMFITFITSLTIELIQMGIGRSFDIDDIILNVVGGLFGYLIYRILKLLFDRFSDRLKNGLLLNFIAIVIILVLVFLILRLYGVVL